MGKGTAGPKTAWGGQDAEPPQARAGGLAHRAGPGVTNDPSGVSSSAPDLPRCLPPGRPCHVPRPPGHIQGERCAEEGRRERRAALTESRRNRPGASPERTKP